MQRILKLWLTQSGSGEQIYSEIKTAVINAIFSESDTAIYSETDRVTNVKVQTAGQDILVITETLMQIITAQLNGYDGIYKIYSDHLGLTITCNESVSDVQIYSDTQTAAIKIQLSENDNQIYNETLTSVIKAQLSEIDFQDTYTLEAVIKINLSEYDAQIYQEISHSQTIKAQISEVESLVFTETLADLIKIALTEADYLIYNEFHTALIKAMIGGLVWIPRGAVYTLRLPSKVTFSLKLPSECEFALRLPSKLDYKLRLPVEKEVLS